MALPSLDSGLTDLPANWVMVSGSSSSELAKIGGITPEVLSLSGRWLRSACIMPFCPARLGYWISNRRVARSMKLMNRINPTTSPIMPTMVSPLTEPERPPSNSCEKKLGICATMPAMSTVTRTAATLRNRICEGSICTPRRRISGLAQW